MCLGRRGPYLVVASRGNDRKVTERFPLRSRCLRPEQLAQSRPDRAGRHRERSGPYSVFEPPDCSFSKSNKFENLSTDAVLIRVSSDHRPFGDTMIGQTIGSFGIESWLGAGSLSIVYRGVHEATGGLAAIKVARKERHRAPERLEARARS